MGSVSARPAQNSRRVFCFRATGQRACDTAVFRRVQRARGELWGSRPVSPDILLRRAGRRSPGLCVDMISDVLGRRPRSMPLNNHCNGYILLVWRLPHVACVAFYM